MKKLCLLICICINSLLMFAQAPSATITLTRLSPASSTSCSTVTYHISATNGLSINQHLVIEVFTPSIDAISVSAAISACIPTDGLVGAVRHFYFDYPTVSPGQVVQFDFAFNIPCAVIPIDASHGAGSYLTSALVSSSAFSIPPNCLFKSHHYRKHKL